MLQSNDFCLELKSSFLTDKQHCLGGRFLWMFNLNNNWSTNYLILICIHTNGTKGYCKENTCTLKDQPCSRMNADISAI